MKSLSISELWSIDWQDPAISCLLFNVMSFAVVPNTLTLRTYLAACGWREPSSVAFFNEDMKGAVHMAVALQLQLLSMWYEKAWRLKTDTTLRSLLAAFPGICCRA